MKGESFLLRRQAEIPSLVVQVLRRGMLPQHLRFAIKHNQPGRNPGQCFALKCGRFSVAVFGICFQTIVGWLRGFKHWEWFARRFSWSVFWAVWFEWFWGVMGRWFRVWAPLSGSPFFVHSQTKPCKSESYKKDAHSSHPVICRAYSVF